MADIPALILAAFILGILTPRGTLACCRVTVCEHLDGRVSLHYGPQCVGQFSGENNETKSAAEKGCGKDGGFATLDPAQRDPLSHSPGDDGAASVVS